MDSRAESIAQQETYKLCLENLQVGFLIHGVGEPIRRSRMLQSSELALKE